MAEVLSWVALARAQGGLERVPQCKPVQRDTKCHQMSPVLRVGGRLEEVRGWRKTSAERRRARRVEDGHSVLYLFGESLRLLSSRFAMLAAARCPPAARKTASPRCQ